RAIGMSTDITKEKELELAYRNELTLLQAMMTDVYAQTLYDTVTGKQITYLSQDNILKNVFKGLSLEEFSRKASETVFDNTAARQLILNQTPKEFKLRFLSGETEYSIDYTRQLANNTVRWVRYSTRLIEDPTTGHLMAFLYLRDIDEQKRHEEELQKAADTDSLTGLYNHAGAINRMKQYLNDHQTKSCGVLFAVDLDEFKSINDTLGHQCGDNAIAMAGKSLLALFRAEDIIGRVGGDEFLILMENVSGEAAAAKKAAELVNALQMDFSADGRDLLLSASIGAAIHKIGEDFDALYGRADSALYQAKNNGRKCYHIDGVDEASAAKAALLIQQSVSGIQLRTLLENIDAGILMIEVGRLLRTLYISPSFYKTSGLTRECVSADGRSLLDMILPEDRDGFEEGIRRGAAEGTRVDYTYRIVDAVENRAWRHVRAVRIDYEDSDYPVMLAIITDISQLKHSSSLLNAVFKNSPVGIALYEIDKGYKPLMVNDSLLSMTCLTREDFFETNKINAFSLVDPADVERVRHEVGIGVGKGRPIEVTFGSSSKRNGENYYLQAKAVVLTDAGTAPILLAMYQDVTDQAIVNEKLRQRANHDPLTGLYNREAFFEKAEKMISSQPPAYYVMAYFDIDNFKVINDQYGNKTGDMVLQHISQVFRQTIYAAGGICCRVSGDIFAALYLHSFIDSETIDSIHRSACRTSCLDKPLSFSVGRYIVDDITLPVSAMYDRAALAAETVKGRYDVHIAVYNEAMREKVLQEQELTSEMNGALTSGQFETWLQPQFNHSSGALVGAEALVRWRHPQKGLIPPGVFIPVFERNGFVYEVDKYVWEQSCALLRKWLDENRSPLPISVNVSRYDIFREDFFDTLTGFIKKYALSVDLLRLEITESAFAQASEQIIDMVERLKAFGFTIEIDDFGSGYSSLNTLKDVPANIIKLDMKFLEAGRNSSRGGNIIESVVRMAKWLGMPIIAEGVEDKQQADYLKSIGCKYVQGYLYAKPMPVTEYEIFTENSSKEHNIAALETVEALDNNAFWDPKSMETLIFNSYVGGACIFEYKSGMIELLRINKKYVQEFGNGKFSTEQALKLQITDYLDEETKRELNTVITHAAKTGSEVTCNLWLYGLPQTSKRVCIRSSMRMIARADERMLFYCSVENITAQKEAEQSVLETSKQLSFLNDLSRDLLFSADSNQAINSILQKTLDYFAGARAYVFEIDRNKKVANNTYEICAGGVSAEIGNLQNVSFDAISFWLEAFDHKDHISIGEVSKLSGQRTEERHILLQQGISSLVAVPLRCGGKMIGFMGVDDPSVNQSHVEHLEALGDYMAVVLTRRDLNAEIVRDDDARIRLMEDMPGGFARMRMLSETDIQLEYVNEGMGKMLGMTRAEVIS
ncbi:MAG: EAL domain-containing protein, partial [Eubacteriales bacterium]